jgi:hypothetical protein
VVDEGTMVTINHSEAQERMKKGMPITNPAQRASTLPVLGQAPAQPANGQVSAH